VRGKAWNGQAYETDKRTVVGEFRSAEAEAIAVKIRLNLVHQNVALMRGKQPREKLHDAWVGI
jgi:hypothetical protein